MADMVKWIRRVHHNVQLVAEIECKSGTARAGAWVWRVRSRRRGKVVATSASSYRRRHGAQRGLTRHFPQAVVG